jgi:hypothetical protein
MNNLLRHLMLKAQVNTGMGADMAAWGIAAIIAVAVTAGFLLLSTFIWLANRYDPLAAGLVLSGVFALVTFIAIGACLISRSRNSERARLALAARSNHTNLLDPRFAAVALQIGSAIGWRRLASLSAVGLLAAGLAREWFGHNEPRS